MADQVYLKEEIDGYIIFYNKQIGRGAFASVYECENKKIKEPLCVKVSNQLNQILRSQKSREMVAQRESDILRRIIKINNPNLIKVYHIVQENQIFYIFMRRYQCNLQQWMDKKKEQQQSLSLEEIFKIIYQLVNGYKSLYENNIIHRDLKPENILVGDDGLLKIADFGLGKIIENLETIYQQTMLGTLAFASPSIFIDGNYSSKTDVYSIGVLIYVLTFGKHFVSAEAQMQFMVQLKELLQYKQLKLPSIENQGDAQLVNELVDFFKVTITYEENDRIDWPSLFQWFPLKELNPYILQVSQCFSSQGKQIVQQFLQSKQINQSQDIQQQTIKQQTSCKPIIREVNLLESSINDINQQKSIHPTNKSKSFVQQSRNSVQNLLESQSVQQFIDFEQFEDKKSQQSGSTSEKIITFNSTATNSQRQQESMSMYSSNMRKSQGLSLSGKFKITEEKDYSVHIMQQLPELSYQSIVSFKSQEFLPLPFLISLRDLNQRKLTKRQENKVHSFIKLMFAKSIIADQTQEYLEKLMERPFSKSNTLSSYSYPLQGLKLLLIAYKYSLIYNGYSIAFEEKTKKKTVAWKLLNEQLTPKIVQEYIFITDLEVSSQKSQLLQLHEQTKQNLENCISMFFNQQNQQFAEFQRDFNTLFNQTSSFWNYNNFSKLYGEIFKITFSQSIHNSTDNDLIKFLAYSLKFIRLEEEYPLEQFYTIDLGTLILNDDHRILLENIKFNASYIRFI